jgi:hypothetical protein
MSDSLHCDAREDDELCCLHEKPDDITTSICCWCGDLYMSHHDSKDGHGTYLPQLTRSKKE